MMKGHFSCVPAFLRIALLLILVFVSATLPLLADGTNAAPVQPMQVAGDNFGQYLANHENDLAPFFSRNASDLFKQVVPLMIGMTGWIIVFTMLLGWGLDILLSRAYAFFFAPAYAEWKRSIIYATGGLFLSFVYKCLMGLAIVFSLNLSQAELIVTLVLGLLVLVAFAAQVVWVLYLYRTSFPLSTGFYLVIIVVHTIAFVLLTGPVLGARAPSMATNFIDSALTPKLQAEAQSVKRELATAKGELNSARSKTAEFQGQITQAQAEKERLHREIEEKKNSDIYILAQIVKARANGDLPSARDQLAAFPAKFPNSLLNMTARAQLADVNNQLALETQQQKQQETDAAEYAAQAKTDLLERASKGEVTLSEMRQALINKTRPQVKDFLGTPNDSGTDSWAYRQQMIVNPLTGEKHGLKVYFNQGLVQSVDYYRYGELR